MKISLFVAFALVCFSLSPAVQAVVPPPDGGYANFTTAEGTNALLHLGTGAANTGVGWYSLSSAGAGNFNTGVGAGSLALNTADSNTATGAAALFFNTAGTENTAVGTGALELNDTGSDNTANGAFALFSNTSGGSNTAIGHGALQNNVDADENTAVGGQALFSNFGAQNTALGNLALTENTSGVANTASGRAALIHNTTGGLNTANGDDALFGNATGSNNTAIGAAALESNTTGSNNTALGFNAGFNATTGDNNVYIGAGMEGVVGDSNACYIASIFGQTSANGIPVLINSNSKLGTTTSSRRFKEHIKPMDKASEALFSLTPVTFRYRKEIDPAGTSQLGLVAEDVDKVNPDLVVRDKEGKPYTVRYDQVNAMLLNEFLKEHRAFIKEQRKVEELKTTVAQQHKDFKAALVELKAQIQKVSAELELSKSAPQTVLNNH